MSVSVQAGGILSFVQMNSGMKSTQEKAQRQQKCDSQVEFFEKQKANLKNVKCSSLEDIARKLEMFHSYEDQIAAAKKQFNNSQMMHILDEAKEIGEKIAEEAEKTAPKTEEERREDRIEEAAGSDEESKGMLTEIMDEITEVMEELDEELEEELEDELKDGLENSLDKEPGEELKDGLGEELKGSLGDELNEGLKNSLDKEPGEELKDGLGEELKNSLDENEAASVNTGKTEAAVQSEDSGQMAAAGTLKYSQDTMAENVSERIIRERAERRAEEIEQNAVRQERIFEAEVLKNYRHIDYQV